MAAAKSPDPPAHWPFVPDEQHIPEFTLWRPGGLAAGDRLRGLVALPGAESRADGLGVDPRGRAVDHAVPGFSKVFGIRGATILENNIVQTTGSAGESIAFGVA